jgi:release factor glutamine methyltransferase
MHQVLAAARSRLTAAGISPADAAIDVDLFARVILGWDRAQLIVGRASPPPPGLEPRLWEWVARRAQHEPTAYIVGGREFWGLDFLVTPSVLIPRPETELIVEEALRLLAGRADVRLADIGTGSGCIAVSVAHDLPRSRIVATDVSFDALAIAQQNAMRHGVSERIVFVQTPYLDGVGGNFDLITANPPYVKAGDWEALSPDVQREPHVAIIGGAQGLRDVEGVLDSAVASLRPEGWLVMEFGYGQEDDVRRLVDVRSPELRLERVLDDLQGIARTLVARKDHRTARITHERLPRRGLNHE